MEGREGTEAFGPGRLDGGAQPFDDRSGRAERDARRVVRALLPGHGPSLSRALDEQLAEELRPALRAAADEAHDSLTDFHAGSVAVGIEDLRERLRLARRIVRLEVQLRQPQFVALCEQLVDPLARRMKLEPVAGVGGDERAASAVLLDAQVVLLSARDRGLELVLVEHEPEVVDARRRPLARLDDD